MTSKVTSEVTSVLMSETTSELTSEVTTKLTRVDDCDDARVDDGGWENDMGKLDCSGEAVCVRAQIKRSNKNAHMN